SVFPMLMTDILPPRIHGGQYSERGFGYLRVSANSPSERVLGAPVYFSRKAETSRERASCREEASRAGAAPAEGSARAAGPGDCGPDGGGAEANPPRATRAAPRRRTAYTAARRMSPPRSEQPVPRRYGRAGAESLGPAPVSRWRGPRAGGGAGPTPARRRPGAGAPGRSEEPGSLDAGALLGVHVDLGAAVEGLAAGGEQVHADRHGDVLDLGVVVGGGGSGHGAQGEGGGGEEAGGGGDALHCVPFGHAASWRTRCPRSVTYDRKSVA